ncbi:DUF2790 domain-containing protein [Pseudomonas sp. A-RE-19]|uniref:DUF2790 domain-containing protein n=1 Tax=Pseudomonas sp. A-RE-19 TaxID=2832401 RepID=UPI001CBCB1FD|nr:DUF2790 domain-containing protein [Pseudomonas sp. A-RE-19]
MNILKIAVIVALGSAGAQAFADESHSTTATRSIPVETYTYETKLDIKKVINVTDIADQCGPVPAQMTYEDSHGQQHILQYQVMGTGCSNG